MGDILNKSILLSFYLCLSLSPRYSKVLSVPISLSLSLFLSLSLSTAGLILIKIITFSLLIKQLTLENTMNFSRFYPSFSPLALYQ